MTTGAVVAGAVAGAALVGLPLTAAGAALPAVVTTCVFGSVAFAASSLPQPTAPKLAIATALNAEIREVRWVADAIESRLIESSIVNLMIGRSEFRQPK